MEQLATEHETWPTDRGSLLAFSDAAAAVDLWAAAARFGEHAVSPDPRDVATRLEVAWRMWRAGRSADALGLLAALPDEVHPALPVLRAAAVATRNRTPAAVDAMLATAGRLPSSPQNLVVVALAATQVGDRVVARDAAERYLATVRPDEPAMRGIVAPAQAVDGETAAAVASTEQACAGRAAHPDAPVDTVVAELRAAGQDDVAARYLAEGFLQTGRLRYGELLDQLLPVRLRRRDTGTTPGQTTRTVDAVTRYRNRVGRRSPVLPVLVAAVAGFGYGAWKGATRTTETLTRIPLLPLVVGLVFGAVAAAAMATAVVGQRRRARVRAVLQERVPSDRCRCGERDWFTGPAWHDYRAGHLTAVAADRWTGAALLRCPGTAKTWLHVDDADLTVRVTLPEPTGPAPHPAAHP